MAGAVGSSCMKTVVNRLVNGQLRFSPITIQVAGLKNIRPPEIYDKSIPEKPKLKYVQKLPDPPHRTEFRNLIDIRGPELHDHMLKHRQYGIQALGGGYLRHGHFEMMRFAINRYIGRSQHIFAEWRIDAPNKPITKRPQGTRLGGGKANIDHWVTPVRHGRIVLELAGKVEWKEVKKILSQVAHKLPFPAKAVSQVIMDRKANEQWDNLVNNQNPWTYERIVRGNYLGINKHMGPYDYKWFGKHK